MFAEHTSGNEAVDPSSFLAEGPQSGHFPTPRIRLPGRRWKRQHTCNTLSLCFAHLSAVKMVEKVNLTLVITDHLGVALVFL